MCSFWLLMLQNLPGLLFSSSVYSMAIKIITERINNFTPADGNICRRPDAAYSHFMVLRKVRNLKKNK